MGFVMTKQVYYIFALVFILFTFQAVTGYFQIRDMQKALRRMRGKGNIGMGQKKGMFFNGNIIIIVCGSDGVINAAEAMDGGTFLARFHPVDSVWGIPFVGTHLDTFMEVINGFNKKQRKKYRGYVNAIEALDMRLYPEHYTQEELDEVIASQMKNRYYRRAKQRTPGKVGYGKPNSISRAASYVNPETDD